MDCTGKIVESDQDIARVRIDQNACGGCEACGIGKASKSKSLIVNALNEIGANAGDSVTLELSGKKVIGASAILFMIPFSCFIIGYLLGYFLIWEVIPISRDLVSIIFAFLFSGASFYLVHVLGSRSKFEFVVKSFAEKEEGEKPAP